MAIRVSAFTVPVGTAQELDVAQGEDRQFQLKFQDGGVTVNFTGAAAAILTVKSRATGQLIFARSYTGFLNGDPALGTLLFNVAQADTATLSAGPYDCDVSWTDGSGYKEQLLVISTFLVLKRVGAPTDPVTTPPAVPVVYGLNWLGGWSTPSGGYNVNDSVTAQDGSFGATAISTFRAVAQGVTYYPVGQSLLVATGWAYVGQHGGGATLGIGSRLAAATSITPDAPINHVTGTTGIASISNANLPGNSVWKCIADTQVVFNMSGNVGASALVPTGKAQAFQFDAAAALWYPF